MTGSDPETKVLLIGYGNPGRLDDGLGPALAEVFEKKALANVSVDSNYQLSVEDAAEVSNYDVVIFADASVNGQEPFYIEKIDPGSEISFSTHSIKPDSVLALAKDLFQAQPKAYVLGIRGYEFNEFGERISDKAGQNLQKAVEFVEAMIINQSYP